MGALRNERTVRNRRPVCLGARRRSAPSGPCLCTGAWPNIARLPDGGSACRLPFPERSRHARSRDERRRQQPFRSCGIPAKRRTIRLSAASLLEAVVASVVLLIVFAASLETVVRLTCGPFRRNRLRRTDYRACLHGERNPTGSFLRGQDRTLLRMGNADGSHRALRFLSSPMAGDADGENHGRTQKNGIPVSGRSGRFRPKHDHRQ